MKKQSTNAIVLRRVEYGEADRIVTLLTKDFGKVSAIAKSVRKLKSKLAGGIELLCVAEVSLLSGKGSMDTLVSARTVKQFGEIVKDLDRLNSAYDFIKQLTKLTEDGEGSEFYAVLAEGLAALNDSTIPLELTQTWFYLQVLKLVGQQPNLEYDQNGVELGEDLHYHLSPETGCLVPGETEHATIDASAIKALRLMLKLTPKNLIQVNGVVEANARANFQVKEFAHYHLA